MATVRTPTLEIGYEEHGPLTGPPVVLLHGFPDDVRAWDGVTGPLAADGCRVIVPYLRGYGATRFLDPAAPRMAQQAAIGQDLLDLMDALRLERVSLAGYDWGGRAACIVSALHPERVVGLVSGNSYNIQNIARAMEPASPPEEAALWYQYLFHNERGRRALERNRRSPIPMGASATWPTRANSSLGGSRRKRGGSRAGRGKWRAPTARTPSPSPP